MNFVHTLLSKKADLIFLLLSLFWIWYMKQSVDIQNATQVIVDFELAGSLEKSNAIMQKIGASGIQELIKSISLDFVFIPLYSTGLALLYFRAAKNFKDISWLMKIGIILAGLHWLAGGMDAVENRAMLYTLQGSLSETYPYIAKVCASIKFGILMISIPYLLFSLLYWILNKVFSSRNPKT